MKIGDIMIMDSEDDELLHGRKFEAVEEIQIEVAGAPRGTTIPGWAMRDIASGEIRHFTLDHIDTILK